MRSRAFTLLELLVVVAVLAIVGATALLERGSSEALRRLDLATAEVAEALRFARAESLRTGEFHGTEVTGGSGRIRVFRLDMSSSPPARLYDVNHPVDKRLYDLTLAEAPFSGGVGVASASFSFDPTAALSQSSVAFDPGGAPVSPDTLRRLLGGQVALQYGGHSRSVALAPITGRVTLP